jgi:hypothetical protein
LVKHLQDQVRYYVLCLSKENITLLEGTNGSLDPVRVPGMPRGMREFQTHHINHGTSHRFSSGSGMGAGHGGSEFDHEKEDMRSLFKAVDRARSDHARPPQSPHLGDLPPLLRHLPRHVEESGSHGGVDRRRSDEDDARRSSGTRPRDPRRTGSPRWPKLAEQ